MPALALKVIVVPWLVTSKGGVGETVMPEGSPVMVVLRVQPAPVGVTQTRVMEFERLGAM
jgi:hypothetical protein